MFPGILVPLDGSRLAETALQAASTLAVRLGSTITLLHIIEENAPSEIHKDRHLTHTSEAESYLKEVAQRLPATIRVETHVHTAPVSDVARSIVEHAATEFRPDLIVSCTHGRGGVHSMLYGSIAQQVVALGITPLLLIKPEAPLFEIHKILVPLDPDSLHDVSLDPATNLAHVFDAEIMLLGVIPTYATLTGEQAATSSLMPATAHAVLDLHEEQAQAHLEQHIAALKQLDIPCSADVARGDPAGMILQWADRTGSDLILLSTHRKAGIKAFWSKSVAPKVAQGTRTPLLLIPLA